jgi:hypothetical protein
LLQHKSIIVVIQPPFWQAPVCVLAFLFVHRKFKNMKIEELRFGNIVFINEEVKKELEEEEYLHCHFNVTSITDDEVGVYAYPENVLHIEYNIKDDNLAEIIPVSLDNNWKKRFGFISEDFEIWYLDINHDIYFIGNEFWFRGTCLRVIEYVHQLQNLYFDLVGEQLVLQN